MKLTKTASGKQLKISKKEWKDIGKKAGWMKTALLQDRRKGKCPKCKDDAIFETENWDITCKCPKCGEFGVKNEDAKTSKTAQAEDQAEDQPERFYAEGVKELFEDIMTNTGPFTDLNYLKDKINSTYRGQNSIADVHPTEAKKTLAHIKKFLETMELKYAAIKKWVEDEEAFWEEKERQSKLPFSEKPALGGDDAGVPYRTEAL